MDATTDSGLEAFGRLRWGSHVCHFHRSERELADVVVPFLVRGLELEERCVWVTGTPLEAEAARRALAAAVPDLDARASRGQLEILDRERWCATAGGHDPARLLQGWLDREEAARRGGFAGLRITGAAWTGAGCGSTFMEYEARVGAAFAGRRILALCSYPLDGCDAAGALEIVRRHDCALTLPAGAWGAVAPAQARVAEEALRREGERLAQRAGELEAALRAREDLLAIASHELRTPMAALRLLVDSLLRAGDRTRRSADDQQRRLRRAAAQCERMTALLDDLLYVSQPGHHSEISPAEVDLSAIARDAAERMLEPLSRAGCALTISVPAATPGRWDGVRLEQVLTNLLANAARHARGEPIELSIVASVSGPVLAVRDHGPGVPLGARRRVFDAYAQLDGARERGGVGLGLWVVRRIVDAHGGRIEIRDTPGGGATFVVALPWDSTPAVAAAG